MSLRSVVQQREATAPPSPPQSGASRHRGRHSNTAHDASQCGLGRDANVHVCYMLLPASLGLPGISCFFSRSAMPVGTGLLFLLAAALLDQLHLSELSIAAVAVGLIAFQLAALLSGAVFGMPPGVGPEYENTFGLLRLCLSGQLLTLLGVWAAVNHGRLGRKYPKSMVLLQRVLLIFAPLVASAHVTLLSVSLFGAEAAPYAVAVACAAYRRLYATSRAFVSHLNGKPLKQESADTGPSRTAEDNRCKSSGASRWMAAAQCSLGLEGQCAAFIRMFLLVQGPLFHICLFRHAFLANVMQHAATVVLLTAIPLILSGSRAPLMQIGSHDERVVRGWSLVASVGAIVATTLAVEIRIIFTTFAPYLKLAPPMSYLLVTISMVSGAVGASGFLFRELFETFGPTLLGVFLSLSACTGAVVLGMPLLFTPAPLVAVGGFVLYAESFNIIEYAIFVAGSVATGAWFLWEHYWHIDANVGSMTMQSVCKIALVGGAVAALIPGIVVQGMYKAVNNLLLLAQAICVAMLEKNLVEADVVDGMPVYAPYLVIITSVAGISIVRAFHAAGYMSSEIRCLLLPIYLGKVILVVAPSTRHLMATVALLTAFCAPMCLSPAQESQKQKGTTKATGAALCLFGFSAILAARFAIFDTIAAATGYRPYNAFLIGVLITMLSIHAFVVQQRHFRSEVAIARVSASGLFAGILICLTRPPIPAFMAEGFCISASTCFRLWDEDPEILMSALSSGTDIAALPIENQSGKWLLVLALLSGGCLCAKSVGRRSLLWFGLAVTTGTSFGAFISAGFGWEQTALVVTTSILVAATVSGLIQSSVYTPGWIPKLCLVYLPFVFLSLLLASRESDFLATVLASSSAAESSSEVLRFLCWTYMVYSIMIAFAIKLRIDKLSTARSGASTELDAVRERLAKFGNINAILASVLSSIGTGSSHELSIIWSSGILLLYNAKEAATRSRNLPQMRSYFPAYISALLFLVGSTATQIYHGPENLELFDGTWQDEMWIARNVSVLLMALASHFMFLLEFWVRSQPSRRMEKVVLLVALINIPSFFLTSFRSTRIIAIFGAFCGGLHIMILRFAKSSERHSI